MSMVPIDIPAGVVNQAAKARRSSNWRETHLVRWNGDTIMPIGGWAELVTPTFASKVRLIHKWMINTGVIYTAYLCESHVYIELEGAFTDITPVGGMTTPSNNVGGFGDYKFGAVKYGTPRPGENRRRNYAPTFSMDNWGDQLRVMTSYDGRLLGWDPAVPGALLVARPNAPVANRSFIVTPERHIMLFGMGGKMDQFGWCDQEDDTNWDFASLTSKAGYYDLEPSSPIVAHQQFFGGIYMATMANNYHIRPIGLPYVYAYDQIADAGIPISPLSIARIPDGVVWSAIDGFWLFNGNSTEPIVCPISDWIQKRLDVNGTIGNGFMFVVEGHSEIWWFFTDQRDTTQNSMLTIFDYRANWWSMGRMHRTCGFMYGNEINPIMSDGDKIYKHEFGFSYEPEPFPWAETFTINTKQGDGLSTFHQMRPEMVKGRSQVKFSLMKQMDRSQPDIETQSTLRAPFGDGLVDFRETARDFRLRVDMVANDDWSLGPMMMDIRPRGKK
jgi:hypothetical protein